MGRGLTGDLPVPCLFAQKKDSACVPQSAEFPNLTPAKKLVTSAKLSRIILPAGEETTAETSLPYRSGVTLAPFSNISDSIAIFDRSYCC